MTDIRTKRHLYLYEWQKNMLSWNKIRISRYVACHTFKRIDMKESAYLILIQITKLCFETKMTKTWNGHFTSVSGHFFANYISFHKTEVLKVILKGQTCHNLNWIKSYTKNTICFLSFYFQFCKNIFWKYATHKWPFYDYFWQLRYNTSKNWDSDHHFELLSESKS